jgi:DNA-directed RNA polymerase specialized sigma subunit
VSTLQDQNELSKLAAIYDTQEDIDKIKKWQQTKDPTLLIDMVSRYQPVVSSIVNKFGTVGVSKETLKARANTQLLKALNTYNPKHETSPTTHVWNNLQKVQRLASESLQSGHIPENRNMKMAIFKSVRDNLNDRLGYEPNNSQMSDEMNWSQAEVQRMNEELAGEITASNSDFDFYGNARQFANRDRELVDYLYHELAGKDKTIFEHTFGYGGKKIMKNKELAVLLNTNEMSIHRAKQRLSNKIKEYK